MLALLLRLFLWAVALFLIVVWLAAAAVVWIVEALIAWRRGTSLPAIHVPRHASDAKFGRTLAAAAAVVAVLALIGGAGNGSSTSQPVQARAATSVPTTSSQSDPTTTAVRDSSRERARERKARAERRARRRAAKARAERRAAQKREAAKHNSAPKCDPSYTGACLDPNASDYDCEGGSGDGPEYTGTVTVVGDDHFDLDRDGDGIGCE
ncbi:MAG: hypothetical protein QOG35_1883 [Solirubrobacteraceae bacterium]|jgi:hypothetical protein|nr:hypothetical protein [Solirubrobacteraceae bacterium]